MNGDFALRSTKAHVLACCLFHDQLPTSAGGWGREWTCFDLFPGHRESKIHITVLNLS